MDKKAVTLKVGENIILKTFTPQDAPTIFALIDSCREHLNRNNENTAKKYPDLESFIESIVSPKKTKRLRFGIWDNDVFVGSVNIEGKGNGKAELGYWVGEQYLGKGYAGTASYRLIQSTFKGGRIKLIIAKVAETNEYSFRIIEKLGFFLDEKKEGERIYHLERWLPFYVNACLLFGAVENRVEWEKAKSNYPKNPNYLLDMRLSELTLQDDPMPDFGEGVRYTGITLRDWMTMKNLDPNQVD